MGNEGNKDSGWHGPNTPKTTDVLELVVAFLEHTKAEHWRVFRGLGGLWLASHLGSFFFSLLSIKKRSSRHQCWTSVNTASQSNCPPSVFLVASLHKWVLESLKAVCSLLNMSDTTLSHSMSACAVREKEKLSRFLPGLSLCVCVCLAFSAFVLSVIKWKHSQST